jgi:hypothetical protein
MIVRLPQQGQTRGSSESGISVTPERSCFRLWQCDKKNHGWREGPPLTVPCQSFDLLAGPSPSGKVSQSRTKKEYCFPLLAASLILRRLFE